uniref:Uncharacterized protein n=1 Tax=Cacopsylla melanoneura TaxID=428564 RepID=A0A8D8LUV9_9HEMI
MIRNINILSVAGKTRKKKKQKQFNPQKTIRYIGITIRYLNPYYIIQSIFRNLTFFSGINLYRSNGLVLPNDLFSISFTFWHEKPLCKVANFCRKCKFADIMKQT